MKLSEVFSIWKNSLRMFFAPLVGAVVGAVHQTRAVGKDVLEHRPLH